MLSSQSGATTTSNAQPQITCNPGIPSLDPHQQSETEPISSLVNRDGQVLTISQRFEQALAAQETLTVQNGALMPLVPSLRTEWLRTLRQVLHTGKGSLFKLPHGAGNSYVAIVPSERSELVAIRLPHNRLCPSRTVTCFASLIGLTPRETVVMDKITQGLAPAAIADELATQESTVRTQVKSILAKSNHHSVRELLITLARLPSTAPANALTSGPADSHGNHNGCDNRVPSVTSLNAKLYPS